MDHRQVTGFIALAYAISWGIYAIGKWAFGVEGPLGWTLVSALFMLGPAIAAFILRKPFHLGWRQLGVARHGIRWKWVGIAVLSAIAFPLFTLFFNWLLGNVAQFAGFGHTEVTKDMLMRTLGMQLQEAGQSDASIAASLASLRELPLNGTLLLAIMLVTGALAGCTVNLVFALGEELGWRGMLFHFTRRWRLGKHLLITGIVWGLWHAPLILEGHNYPGHRLAGVFFMCLFTTVLALPLAWVRLRSNSVCAPAAMHGTINAVAGVAIIFTSGGHELLGSIAGISGILGLLAIAGLLFIFDPGFRKEFNQS